MGQKNSITRFDGGIAASEKDDSRPYTYDFCQSVEVRTNKNQFTLLPKTVKESGSVVTALPKWAERVDDDMYVYDEAGSIYNRTSAGSYSKTRTVSSSHGNGMAYYPEDHYLYYTSDKVVGRYGPMNGTPAYADDFLGSEGGVPLNTNSLELNGSTQYGSKTDSASLSITGDLTLEAWVKHDTFPSAGNEMGYISKWDESGATRSYKFGLYAVSGYFGDGSDGSLTISSDTTDAPIDSACTGTSGSTSLSATNASFAAGQVILIHQSQGTNAGTYMRNKISSYTAGTITLETALNASYTSGAQVLVLKQYTNVTVNSTKVWSAKAWNGTVGGILAFLANGTVTISGTIYASGKGYRGGNRGYYYGNSNYGRQGESYNGNPQGATISANYTGGGGAYNEEGYTQSSGQGGGGGGHATSGSNGNWSKDQNWRGVGGGTYGNASLTTMVFGGGGGGGGMGDATPSGSEGWGQPGGGIVLIYGTTITNNGYIQSKGLDGTSASGDQGGGGAGAGGSILLKCQTATLGTGTVIASGGARGSSYNYGGAGGDGRIHIDYYTSYTGTTTPTIDYSQDNTLVTNTTYQMRLSLSTDGTNPEYLTKNVTIDTNWHHVSVTWTAASHLATYYLDGVSLGTTSGALTAIHDNASALYIGGYKGASAVGSFFDGLIDEVRVFNSVRTASQLDQNKSIQIASTTSGLKAYYLLNADSNDSTSNANNLTLSGSPSYSTNVPFASPTTRLDLDQYHDVAGQTYTLATSISETSSNKQTFVPAKDPQKSIQVNIASKGTGDWTLTVHDGLNRLIASKTVVNASLNTGDFEFVFSSVWRPVIGATYHFHLTSTVADGTVVTNTTSDLSTVDYHTYYQFLVTDTNFHPVFRALNKLFIGNGRYVARYASDAGYEPHEITLPVEYTVRCFATYGEYYAIGCLRGSSITDYDDGMIFFWDGISETYNYYVKVPFGGVNAMMESEDGLHIWAGYQGDHILYQGGKTFSLIDRIKNSDPKKTIEVFPGAMTNWRKLLHIGIAGNSTSTDIYKGVYSYGSIDSDINSTTYDYPISTGTIQGTGVRVGMVATYGNKLLIGWQDNTAYGVDIVDPAGSPFASGTVEFLVRDEGAIWLEKHLMTVRAEHKPLISGESIDVKYKLNRASSWTNRGANSTVGETNSRLIIDGGQNTEYQMAIDLFSTTTTSPTVTGLSWEAEIDKTNGVL